MRGDYLRLGLLVGAAVVLVGHFATLSARGSDNQLFLFWVGLGLGVGLLIAFALERSARGAKDKEPEEGTFRTVSSDFKTVIPTSSRFYALSRKPSSSELRALMVDAPAIPGNPLASRLQLIVERHDAYSRVQLVEGSLLDYPVPELAERARDEAQSRKPASASDAQLELAAVRSEGPLDSAGRSPFGWTFEFTDGAIGVRCTATVTDSDMLLLYRTTVSYAKGRPCEWLAPSRALAAVREAFAEADELDLYLRVELPDEYYLYSRNPLALFELDSPSGSLIGPDLLPPLERPAEPRDDLTVASIEKLLTEDQDSPLRAELLGRHHETFEKVADRLFAAHGPVVVRELVAAASRSVEQDPATAGALVRILSWVPSGLAVLALVQLSEQFPPELEGVAFSLFEKRRRGELEVQTDPIGALDFADSRAMLGRTDCERVALRSTYNPEGELLPELDKLGLVTTRTRLLSGDTELFLSANLATSDRSTEALLSSSPLPVPCHVLRIVGPQSEALAEKIRASKLAYSNERIIQDVLEGRPYDIHRGALYLAAMGIDAPETFDALALAASGHRTNIELRRAALAALAQLTHDGVDTYLEEVDDTDLLDLARALMERRRPETSGELVAIPETPDQPG